MPRFVDLALARRLEMAHAWRGVEYARAQQALHPDWQVAVEPVAGGYAIYVGPGSPVNRAVGLGLHGPVHTAELQQVERFYCRRGAPPRIDLCPLADPSLQQWVNLRPYRLEQFFSVLFCHLPDDVVPQPWPTEVRVTRADPEQAELWIRTTAQGYGEEDVPTQETLDILAPNFHSQNAVPFLAWIDGEPAGGGALFIHEGVAEFGGDSTRPAFRQRGVQTALLQARLAAARELGCDLAMVLTEPGSGSQRNVQRAGLGLAYTKVTASTDCADLTDSSVSPPGA